MELPTQDAVPVAKLLSGKVRKTTRRRRGDRHSDKKSVQQKPTTPEPSMQVPATKPTKTMQPCPDTEEEPTKIAAQASAFVQVGWAF